MNSSDPTQPYPFRPTTLQNHAQTYSRPSQLQGRKILPPNATPTVTATNTDGIVDAENTEIKVKHQLCTHYILAQAEKTLGTRFERGHTALQGAREKKDYQAAHGCFIPEPEDDFTKTLADRIVTHGVTPTKTKPFLKNRFAFSSPNLKELDERHQEENFVRQSLQSQMPPGGNSSLTNTRFHWNCNATHGNPDESNQYDTHFERKIAPFLKELQDLRAQGLLTPEESVERIVNWRLEYHAISIAHLETQLVNIDKLSFHFDRMRAFELGDLSTEEEFTSYLEDVNQFLTCYDALTEKKLGCPSCSEFKSIRNDFSFLRKLQSMAPEDAFQFYLSSSRHLSKEMHCDRDFFATKYRLYLDEAKAQQAATKDFEDPCVIPNLSKMLFGIVEDGVRRAPTEEELKEQVFKLFAVATPIKEKMAKRREREESKENINSLNFKRPRLNQSLSF